jgi:hypothetical protein
MSLENTIPNLPDPAVVEAANIVEALHDRAGLHSQIVFGLVSALGALSSPLGNRRVNWRTIAAGLAALHELGTPPFAGSREIRLSICEAAFCWWGGLQELVSNESLPMAAAFRSRGTVH